MPPPPSTPTGSPTLPPPCALMRISASPSICGGRAPPAAGAGAAVAGFGIGVARSGGGKAGSGEGRRRRATAAAAGMDGLSGSVDGLAGLSMDFFLFFYSINCGGQTTVSKNSPFTVTFVSRRLQKPPRLIIFARFH